MLEFHGNQHGHDHPEQALEDAMVKRIQRARNQKWHDTDNQLHQCQRDDQGDNQAQDNRHNEFETIVKGHQRPLLKSLPHGFMGSRPFVVHIVHSGN